MLKTDGYHTMNKSSFLFLFFVLKLKSNVCIFLINIPFKSFHVFLVYIPYYKSVYSEFFHTGYIKPFSSKRVN